MALTLSSQSSYHMYSFQNFLTNSHFSNNSHTSPSNFHTFHTLLIILTSLQLPKHIPHDYHTCPITVRSDNFHTFMRTVMLSDNCYSIMPMLYLWSSHLSDSCDISFVVSTPHQLSHLTNTCLLASWQFPSKVFQISGSCDQ